MLCESPTRPLQPFKVTSIDIYFLKAVKSSKKNTLFIAEHSTGNILKGC